MAAGESPQDRSTDSQQMPRVEASRSGAIPIGSRVSSQLEALQQRSLNGGREDVERLGKWAALAEQETNLLRRRLRKQQHDFATLFRRSLA